MESVNVFVTYKSRTFGLLVPIHCKYVELVEMLSVEMKIGSSNVCLKIEYEVEGDLSPIRITNNNSLLFYIELKRRDHRLTAYALRVEVEELLNMSDADFDLRLDSSYMHLAPDLEHGQRTSDVLIQPSFTIPTMQEFASSMQLSLPEEYEVEENYNVITTASFDSIAVNKIFRDKDLLKKSIALYAIQNNFQFSVYRSDNREYVLKCLGEGCKWKFRGSKMGQTDMFKIRYIQNDHSCELDAIIRDHRQAKSSLIGDFVKHKYTSAKTIYTPVDIMHDMSKTYGLKLRYGKAWRAREHALENVMGDPDDAYMKLPMYLRELKRKNVGSKTSIEIDGNGHFKYAYMSLDASIQGWKYCKPIVVVDATFLTGRYGGSLFTACTQDTNNSIFILAFGVGDSENNDSWFWFLSRLKEAYGERRDMCIISDRHPSIEHATRAVYPGVPHVFCAHHILQNLRAAYGNCGSNITRPFNSAARAYTKHEFEYYMMQLDQINKKIRQDLEKVGFERWSRSHMQANRYGAMTSNIVESVNAVSKSVKHCPIDYLFEALRNIVQSWFFKNRNIAQGTFTRLATSPENLLRRNAKHSLKLKVSASNEFLYQVSDEGAQHVVDLKLMACTCNQFQMDGVPCQHALAVVGEKGDNQYNYCSQYHTKDSYLASYAGNVVPLGDDEQWKVNNYRCHDEILPPISKRQPGRPKKKRQKTRLELSHSTCRGRCGSTGHNRRTCKQPRPLSLLGKRKRSMDE